MEFYHPTMEKVTPIKSRQGLELRHPTMGKVLALRSPYTQQQLKSQLLLVNFYFVLAQFQIKRARFSLVFTTYVQFCKKNLVPYF